MTSVLLDAAPAVDVTYERGVVQSDPGLGLAITGLRNKRRARIFTLRWEAARRAEATEALRHHAQYGGGAEFDFTYQGATVRVSYDGPLAIEQNGGRFAIGIRLRQEG